MLSKREREEGKEREKEIGGKGMARWTVESFRIVLGGEVGGGSEET